METKKYSITGMTCSGCVASVKSKLEELPEIQSAEVQLDWPQARLHLNEPVAIQKLQESLYRAGNYQIAVPPSETAKDMAEGTKKK